MCLVLLFCTFIFIGVCVFGKSLDIVLEGDGGVVDDNGKTGIYLFSIYFRWVYYLVFFINYRISCL